MTAAQEWMFEGMEKGENVALASILTKVVRLRFRDVRPDSAARSESATKADLERWIERILTAETLDYVFA